MKKLLLICSLFLMPLLSAYTNPCPGQFGVSVEWLYMLPAYDQPNFVINSSDSGNPIGKRVANEQDWHSGYRIEAIYAFCNCPNNIRARWTHFPTFTNKKSVSGPYLFGVFNVPVDSIDGVSGTLSLTDSFDFHTFELLFDQNVLCCGPFQMNLQGGIQYSYLHFKEHMKLNGSNRELKNHSKLWGIGPEIGYDFSYKLFNCLTLTGRGNASLLISKRDDSFSDGDASSRNVVPVPVYYKTPNTNYWNVIPTTNVRFGLSYCTPLDFSCFSCLSCLKCINMDIEVGYEVISYYKGLNRIFFVDDVNQGSSTNNLMDFTLHGPYVHLGFTY